MDESAAATVYEIRFRGYLDQRRARQFAGMKITRLPEGDTILVGPVQDQSALYGLLGRIRDLGVTLISVERRAHPSEEDDEGLFARSEGR